MNDALGRELKVGDTVAAIHNKYTTSSYRFGVVEEFTPTMVAIKWTGKKPGTWLTETTNKTPEKLLIIESDDLLLYTLKK